MADPARGGGGRHVHFAAPTTSPYRINPGDRLATPSLSRPVSRPPTGHVTGVLAPPWPFNPEETALIRAGYKPCYTPKTAAASSESVQESGPEPGNAPSVPKSALKKPGDWRTRQREERRRTNMAEPRARAARHKGQMNFAPECMCEVLHHHFFIIIIIIINLLLRRAQAPGLFVALDITHSLNAPSLISYTSASSPSRIR